MATSKKKILHTTTRLVRGGGVEYNIFYTIDQLKNEFEFHLASGIDFQENPFENDPSIKIIICKDLINSISPIKDLKALWFFYKLIKKEKYDIVHTHETKASFVTKLAAWLAKCPYIIYGLHGVTFNDPMSKLKRKFYIYLEKFTINTSDIIVSVSDDTIKNYHDNNIGNHIPFEVVRSGIDITAYLKNAALTNEEKIAFRKKSGISNTDIVITNVGRFSKSKAQRFTIEAFVRLKAKYTNLKLLLIGEGELLEDCKSQVNQLLPNSKDDVIFMGYQKNIPQLLSISDIFMFTSLREGLPRAVVEASILKIPVVAFTVEGIHEIIEHEKSGFIVPQYDIDNLVKYAEKLIINPDLRTNFGEKSSEYVKAHWDKSIMATQLKEIYNKEPK